MKKNAIAWLVIAIILNLIGLVIGTFGLMIVGAGVSGSGCGADCINTVETVLIFGKSVLIAAALSACYALFLTFTQQISRWVKGVVIAAGLLAAFIAISLFAFLQAF